MTPQWIVCSYYTINTGYAREIQNLVRSLQENGCPMDIIGIESLGSWKNNVHYNNQLILEMMAKYPDKHIVSLDADAVVRKYPKLFDELCEMPNIDFAIHKHEWKNRPDELLCSTMFFKNNNMCRKLLHGCIYRHREYPHESQQPNMLAVYKRLKNIIRRYQLPPTYCKIFDLMKEIKDPVIEQFQASRKYKREIHMMHKSPILSTQLKRR